MHVLTKADALGLITARAAVLDSPSNPVNPFASSAWIHHFIEQVVDDETRILALSGGRDDDRLMLLGHDAATPSRCSALNNYYASLYSPLACLSADRVAAMRSIVQELSSARPRIATVQFAPLAAPSDDTTALIDALRSHGWYVKQYFAFGNWTLPCEGMAYDAFIAERDSKVRNTLSRKAKKLRASGTLEIITDPADVERGMDAWDAIYNRSWKQAEPYPGFVRGWARLCAERGWLRLGLASVEGKPIAAQLWFTIARRAYIFKLAYDEDYAKWSAGTVLSAHMFEQALEQDKVVEIDYLTGDDAYKSAWMSHRRERIGVLACNLRSAQGVLMAAKEKAASLSAPWRRRLRRPEPAVD